MENKEIQKLLKELPENENNPAFLNKLGIAYLNAGLFKKASEYFALAILLAPEFPQFHNNLGIALAELGEYDKAMMEFRTVLKYDPENQSAMKNIEKLKFIMANQ
jgi:Flp pilus assembly protein TadD